MPILDKQDYPPELRHPKVQGVFIGGCVKRGDGSRFRSKAHSHIDGKHNSWICILSSRRLSDKMLLLHELAHIITGVGHVDKWRAVVLEIDGTLEEIPGLMKSYHKKTR